MDFRQWTLRGQRHHMSPIAISKPQIAMAGPRGTERDPPAPKVHRREEVASVSVGQRRPPGGEPRAGRDGHQGLTNVEQRCDDALAVAGIRDSMCSPTPLVNGIGGASGAACHHRPSSSDVGLPEKSSAPPGSGTG